VLDAGIRAGKVHTDYLSGKDWQKRAAVETAGFGLGTALGVCAGGQAVAAGLSIALLATPAGWIFIIGSSIAFGIVAAKGGDWLGQGLSELLYNASSNISWF